MGLANTTIVFGCRALHAARCSGDVEWYPRGRCSNGSFTVCAWRGGDDTYASITPHKRDPIPFFWFSMGKIIFSEQDSQRSQIICSMKASFRRWQLRSLITHESRALRSMAVVKRLLALWCKNCSLG